MRPAPTVFQLAVCLSSVSPLAAAWPSWLQQSDSLAARDPIAAPIPEPTRYLLHHVRQDNNKNANTANLNTAKEAETETQAADDAKETGKSDNKTDSKDDNKSDNKDSKDSKTDSKDDKDKNKTEDSPKTFDAQDPPGGVTMLTPAATAQATPLYKVGDFVTFGWNYTSLQGSPTAIDVYASCSKASQTWTLTTNMTFETKAALIWDTKNDPSVKETPLLSEMYTLIIKDSDTSITDQAQPGYLGVYSGLRFGMYTPIPYVPLAEWTCPGCNSGLSEIERHAIGFTLTMSLITVATFTWFVTGFGLH